MKEDNCARALRLLYEWSLEQIGYEADITVTKIEDEEKE